ncbi:hypothetical protein NZD89_10180 [Alicyclobacillus fastidiosus]|uniref:GLMA-like second domain-containing protein n=1 Tax=Alicyclobacillus fastidiosus TaxID=392011 RepID=A0ABY6ZLC0_9BACL|nr:hypothetical protein [Alicyclobacillus fastidiosus]WAH43714.1 hypothetical protein NZD89_10180 [Alicyclobacillus fastidiosus]GMA59923.1 hypothetical protein GCM10025859_03630 [Alicyclobacillus fastidiosus]
MGFNPNDYMSELVEDRDRTILNEVIAKREHFAFDGMIRLLVGANIQFEAVDLLQEFTVTEVPTLWVFSTQYMDRELQKRLSEYARAGGKLMLYPEIPVLDLQGHSCRLLAEELGLGEWEVIGGVDTLEVLSSDSVLVRQRLKFSSFEGEVLATRTRDGRQEVAAYKKSVGAGEVVVLGLAIGQEYGYQLDVIREIANNVGIQGHLVATNGELSLVERTNGKESFIFVTNYDDVVQRTIVFEDGTPLFDGEEIMLPPRSGAIYVRNLEIAKDLTISYATVELIELLVDDDKVELCVQPIGARGSISMHTNGNWHVTHGTVEAGERIVIRDITDRLTIVFSNAKQVVSQ